MAAGVERVQLKPETIVAFEKYVEAAERSMDVTLADPESQTWAEYKPERMQQLRKGAVVAELFEDNAKGPSAVPDGLIHDWIGAAWVANRNVQQAVALVQDYDNHKNVYKPEVIESRLLSRVDNEFQIYLRLLKKKIITVVLDTYHEVQYQTSEPQRAFCRSHSTQINEVHDAGKSKEVRLPPDTGYGFLWRLYSYWRFEQREDDLVVECRAISLTRDVPSALAWAINPIVRKLPKESLIHTLEATRKALQAIAVSAV